MIKSNGGSGSVKNVLFDDFLVTGGSAYALDVNQYWSSMSTLDGDGVALSNITFKVRREPSPKSLSLHSLRMLVELGRHSC